MGRSYHVTLLLPIDALGLVIGKGGATLKKIADESGARVQLQEHANLVPNAKNRSIKLSGPIEAIENAEKIIFKQLGRRKPKGYHSEDDEDREGNDENTDTNGEKELSRGVNEVKAVDTGVTEDDTKKNGREEKINEDQITVRWIISNDKIGHLIGRGGDGIKENVEKARQMVE